jgi:ubiquitin-protein ligase
MIEPQYWRSKTSMADILQRIANLVHQDVNPYSPANMEMFRLFKEDPAGYEQAVRNQAGRYAKRA